jgi:HD-GYP domain-containing protein (c-di-GMP phosphodiesterase class II)
MEEKPPPFRLIKRPTEGGGLVSPRKRFKSTGLEYKLRELSYYKDMLKTNDEVHGSIEIDPVSHALIDTFSFQRLRNIKQLGSSDYVYTCATGNRFQHSLGVAHLAESMVKNIKEEQPNLGCTPKDVLCVKLAGLLHDIGKWFSRCLGATFLCLCVTPS